MRSVAKGNYIKGKGCIKHALAHVRYLQMRGGDDRDHCAGKKRLFISAMREGISGSEINERLKKQNEDGVVIHRIVLSPGIPGVNMEAYTRCIMSELEHSKGLDFEYYATEHKNTDHDHTHVVLFGKDQHGRPVTLNKHNYKTVREAGDRYLERNHKYDRYLDKDLETLMRDGYKHDRGDRDFDSLLKDLSSEEWDDQQHDLIPVFDREAAIGALSESERIVRDNVIYSQYSPLEDLIELDRKLNNGLLERVSKEEYMNLSSWIGNKKQFGDDYYERTAEEIRMFQQFEDDFRRSLSADNSPPRSFNQYIFESRGRLLDSHERYTIDMQRLQLQKELAAIQQSESDQELQQGILDQLEWLDAMMDERMESRKEIPIIPRSEKSPAGSSKPSLVENSRGSEAESSIAGLIFGDEQAVDVSLYEKLGVEQQIELWHKIAFGSSFSRYLDDQDFLSNRNSDQVQLHDHLSLELIMQLQVQQILQEQIKESFYESQQQIQSRAEVALKNEHKENDREDPGREHGR